MRHPEIQKQLKELIMEKMGETSLIPKEKYQEALDSIDSYLVELRKPIDVIDVTL